MIQNKALKALEAAFNEAEFENEEISTAVHDLLVAFDGDIIAGECTISSDTDELASDILVLLEENADELDAVEDNMEDKDEDDDSDEDEDNDE